MSRRRSVRGVWVWIVLAVSVLLVAAVCLEAIAPAMLFWGAENGNATAVTAALYLGTDPNAARPWVHGPLLQRLRFAILVQRATAGKPGFSRGGVPSALLVRRTTPLGLAVWNGHVGAAEALLKHGADVNVAPPGAQRPLVTAISHRQGRLVELILRHHPDLGATGRYGQTPLHVAAKVGDVTTARLLLQHGAVLDPYDRSSWTPLAWAAYGGHLDIVTFLLSRGADANGQGQPVGQWMYHKHMTPRQVARVKGHVACAQAIARQGGEDRVLPNRYASRSSARPPGTGATQQELLFAWVNVNPYAHARRHMP